jgi:putative tryptophan/tyrosine transport system substrate-binding protein
MRSTIRLLLGLLCLLTYLPAMAQEKFGRVGLIHIGSAPQPNSLPTTWRSELLRALAQNRSELGKGYSLVERYAEGQPERLPNLAQEISGIGVDVVVAVSDQVLKAVLAATEATPIVTVYGGDPVRAGVAASLGRPGGRVTGIVLQTPEGDVKRLQILREAFPHARRFGYLPPAYTLLDSARVADSATKLGVELVTRSVSGASEYATAFAAMKGEEVAAVIIAAASQLASDSVRVAESAAAHGVPTICEWEYMARAGCVLSYGHDLAYAQRRVAELVIRVLKGEPVGKIPFEQADRWRLTVNVRAAERLKIVLPDLILARADDLLD